MTLLRRWIGRPDPDDRPDDTAVIRAFLRNLARLDEIAAQTNGRDLVR